jgi:hypothetical protein
MGGMVGEQRQGELLSSGSLSKAIVFTHVV